MTETRKPLHFANVRLQNWKNFASCDVSIEKRVFLVGPNASGKSNFLDVFRFLRDLASSGGGFQEAVGRRRGVSAIRCLAARKYPDIEIQVVMVGAEGSPRWRYELGFNQDKQRRARIRKERIERDDQLLLERPNLDDRLGPAYASRLIEFASSS